LLSLYYEDFAMPKRYSAKRPPASHVDEPKVAMSYRLSPAKIARAQRILGTATATSTIEEALDLVVFRRELTDGVAHAFGGDVREVFPDAKRRKRR
jgi:hypothetical protein